MVLDFQAEFQKDANEDVEINKIMKKKVISLEFSELFKMPVKEIIQHILKKSYNIFKKSYNILKKSYNN